MDDPNNKQPPTTPLQPALEEDDIDPEETTVLGQGGGDFDIEQIDTREEEDEATAVEEIEGENSDSGFRLKNSSNLRRAQSVKEIFPEPVLGRARASSDRLKPHLSGSILIQLKGKERYIFDWKEQNPSLVQTDEQNADCCIELAERDLLRIAQGHLNPQIAMLSDKIAVKGHSELAIYFFNLIAPRSN